MFIYTCAMLPALTPHSDPQKLSIVIPLLQKKKLRLREVRHGASQWQSPKAVLSWPGQAACGLSGFPLPGALLAVGFGCFHVCVNLAQPTTGQIEAPASEQIRQVRPVPLAMAGLYFAQ